MTRARTLRAIMDSVPEARPWLWEGYLARGSITALSGSPKVGKTTLLAHLIAAMLDGREDYCGAALTPCPVIYVSEESEVEWQQRAREWPDPVLDGLHLVTREDFMTATDWRALVADVAGQAGEVGAGLLVFDTFRALARLGEGGENDAGKVGEAFEPVRAAAGQGLAILINHHDRKGGGQYGEGASGSGAFFAHVDALVTMRRHDGSDARRRLEVLARWPSPPEAVVEYRADVGYDHLGSRAEVRAVDAAGAVEGVAEQVEAALRIAADPMTQAEVEGEFGGQVSTRMVRRALAGLVASGRVLRSGKGRRGDPFRYASRPDLGAERIESPGGDAPLIEAVVA